MIPDPASGGQPIPCRYCTHPRTSEDGTEIASCGLAGEVTGSRAPAILQVRRAVCELCVQRVPAPDPANPNPVAASIVYVACERILERGGVPECDPGRARALMNWAAQHLDVAGGRVNVRATRHGRRDPCVYLGSASGERPCLSCQGAVRQKVFNCAHEAHADTTILDCGTCPDHEARIMTGGVETWAVGVTTATRAEVTLERSLRSLADAGWEEALVFAEPGSILPDWLEPHRLVQRPVTLGAWPNWLLSLQELTLRYPWADAYLLCQDDVIYCRDVRAYLEEALWPAEKVGVVSLHTALHQEPGVSGFAVLGRKEVMAWGAQAYVFPNAAARALLRSSIAINHRHRGPRNGLCNIDTIVGQWCDESGFPYFVHSPSPTQHVGDASAIWDQSNTDGRRHAGTFPGESQSLCQIMGTPAPDPEQSPNSRRSPVGDSWQGKFAICSSLTGKHGALGSWPRWLLEADLPPHTALFLLDSSGESEFSDDLQAAASKLADSDRFESIHLHIRRTPSTADSGNRLKRDWIAAEAFNTSLQRSPRDEDFIFLLDEDTTPPRDCLPTLVKGLSELRGGGEKSGAISACYPSANPGHFAASRSMVDWTKPVQIDSIGSSEIVKIGAAEAGCLLIDGTLFWDCMPLRGESINGMSGADSYLCGEIRMRGYTIWLHGGTICDRITQRVPN